VAKENKLFEEGMKQCSLVSQVGFTIPYKNGFTRQGCKYL
jgi:hypothetical protein